MQARTLTSLLLSTTSLLLLISCGSDSSGPGSTAVASVTVTPATGAIGPSDTLQLAATLKDAAGNVLSGLSIAWASGTPGVATVSSGGLVTGVAAGSASITASAEGKIGTAAIVVLNPIAIVGIWDFTERFTDTQHGITCSDTGSYVFTQTGARFSGSSEQVGTCSGPNGPFDNALLGQVTSGRIAADSSISFVVDVCQYAADVTGTPPNHMAGTLSCSAVIFGVLYTFTGTWEALAASPVASIVVSPSLDSLFAGETAQHRAALRDAAGRRLFGRPVTWSTGGAGVATVSDSGLVTGVGGGTTDITATAEGQSATVTVVVAVVTLASPIAFVSDGDGTFGNLEIYVMSGGTGGIRRLTNSPGPDWFPSWSPDGAKITFTRDYDIYTMNNDGTNQVRLTNNGGSHTNWQPAWSPDGSQIAFSSDRVGGIQQIFVIQADGSQPSQLTADSAGGAFDPAWSSDGTRIAFTSYRSGMPEIFVMNADGTSETRLTDHLILSAQHPAWSPDGTRIAFINYNGGYPEVYVMDADGTNATQLTDSTLNAQNPAWSRDGTRILFTGVRHGAEDLFLVNPNGTGITPITGSRANERDGDWKP